MKNLITISILLCGSLLYAKTNNTDSILENEYLAGYNKVLEIIRQDNLVDSINGCAFCAHLVGNTSIIVVEKPSAYIVFYNINQSQGYKTMRFAKDIRDLKRIFTNLNSSIYNVNRTYDVEYHPLNSYFILFSSSGEKVCEWNSSTKVRKNKKIYKLIKRNRSFLLRNILSTPFHFQH